MKYLAGMAAAMLLFANDASAQDRVELAPYSNWVANYDDDSCALQRQFGEEGKQAFLELRQFGRGRDVQVIVASKDFPLKRGGGFKVAVAPFDQNPIQAAGFDLRLDPDYEGKLFTFNFGANNPDATAAIRQFAATTPVLDNAQRGLVMRAMDIDWSNARAIAASARLLRDEDYVHGLALMNAAFQQSQEWETVRDRMEAQTAGLVLEDVFDRPIYLRTGPLHAPMEAMRTCLEELSSHWGIDVEAHQTLLRPALPLDYAELVREVQEDYPRRMANKGMQGYLRVRLNVSAEGEPTACHMQSPINDEAFERVACDNMMRHARFAPALDRASQPIASVYQTAIVYMLGR